MHVRELAKLLGISPRTIRHYFARLGIPKPEFAGAKTQYEPTHVLRLRAARWFLEEQGLGLEETRKRLARFSDGELEDILGTAPVAPPPPTQIFGARGSPPLRSVAPEVPGVRPELQPPEALRLAGQRWERVELLPGLELALRDDASPAVRRLAEEVTLHVRGR